MITHQETLGNILLGAGLVDSAGLARALEAQERDPGSLGRALASLGLAEEEAVSRAIAKGLNLESPGLEGAEVAKETAALLPAEFCRRRLAAPLGSEGKSLRLAMADPLDFSTIQDVEFRTGMRVIVVVAGETSILALVKRLYPALQDLQATEALLALAHPEGEVEVAEAEFEATDIGRLARDVNLPPIVRLVNMILSDAAKAGASDIHIEPQEGSLQVRRRVDGQLQNVMKIPRELQASTISRLKIISGMDIAERRKPQDGRSRLRFEKTRIDLRVSTLPTQFGEKVVVRLLNRSQVQLDMDSLDFTADNLRTLQDLLRRPQGLLLVTGPTGSGKTSTLYASLNWLKSPTKNVITVEDPIEIQLPGINQVQITTRTGMTFAAGLRSILRQDPNIVLVGEIRDRETASIALEAAQTGHLLLSTLHTNDATACITRLLDLGVEPFLVASSLTGVLAQRLVRRPCAGCIVDRSPAPETVIRIGGASRFPADAAWKAGLGCEACGQSGYKGRLPIHELLVVTDEIRDLISRRTAEHHIRAAARRSGMRTVLEDAIGKAARGLTTLEEIARVAPPDDPCDRQEDAGTAKTDATISAHNAHTAPSEGTRRVLVVEDSPTIIAVVKYFLELEGFEVLTADSGTEGLELARKHRPDVIVSDLNMPGMDGMALVEALRRDPLTSDAAIVILTSESSVESEARGLAVGADDYLLKPVEPRRLAARVKALLSRARRVQPVSS